MNRRRWPLMLISVCALASGGAGRIAEAASRVEYHEGLPVVYLEGSPYELGHQHGALLRHAIGPSIRQLLHYFRAYLKVPLLDAALVNWWLGRAWRQSRPFVPADLLEELRGLADGSGVPLRELYLLHAIPDRTYACSGFAAWGKATRDGRLIHTRNLDWNIHAGIQRYATVFVVHPTGKRAFVNVGWAGFIGVLTGINDARLSIGQIGAESADVSYRGLPMTFLMRRIMEESGSLDDAEALIRQAPRTVGVNYLVADAAARQAAAVETTHARVAVFGADDPREHAVAYARPIPDAVLRADAAMDPQIRDLQFASHGDPRRPGLEPPGGSAYDIRYVKHAEAIRQHYGRIDVNVAQQIAQSVAPNSNVQSVVFAWPLMRVANAHDDTPAARTRYHEFNLDDLLGGTSPAAPSRR